MPGRGLAARRLAHEVLVRVETTAAFADVLLGERLAGARLETADQGLATRLVYGTLAWQGRLDHHLGPLLHMPLGELEPDVRAALRLGLYQLLFLDRVPAYAAVDASVALVRETRPGAAGRGAGGLVNAVLRRAAAGKAGFELPDPAADPIERLAVEWSHPRWLVERWAAHMSHEELPSFLAANNMRGPTTLRANRLQTTRDALVRELEAAGVAATASNWAGDGIVIARGAARLRALPAWTEGRFAYQGEASQLIAPLLGVPGGARLLDACAAPGGKTAHAAALLENTGLVVALDQRRQGLRRIGVETARLGTRALRLCGDATRPPFTTPFEAILVDAPCSGLGTLRRHPELRWRRRPEDIPRLAALQSAILAGVAPLVRPGGVLVYAVCTLTHEENEAVVERFLAAHPRFAQEDARAHAPAALVTSSGALTTLPHRHGLDAFFAVRLRAKLSRGAPPLASGGRSPPEPPLPAR